ncbi:copper-binding protein [Allosphingosinicella humi]
MKTLYLAMMLGLTTLVAACGEKAETNMMAASTEAAGNMTSSMGNMTGDMNEMAGTMGNMAMSMGDTIMAKGAGTVTALDKATGSITIDHGPIPEAKWPAMKMAFKAKPELLDRVAVGDKVAFDLVLKEGTAELTAISKQ